MMDWAKSSNEVRRRRQMPRAAQNDRTLLAAFTVIALSSKEASEGLIGGEIPTHDEGWWVVGL